MVLTRSVEERLAKLYLQGKLVGTLFRSLGQEATAVGAAYALGPRDVLCPMIRDAGALYVRGHTPREMFASHLGRATSPSRGKEGSYHFGDLSKGTICNVSTMGSTISVVMGAAWARRRQGEDSVGLAFAGDGATSVGDFHESLNLASVLRLPLILLVENNGWAYSTPTSRQMNVRDIAVRAQGYGIPSEIVDGNDVLAVYRCVARWAAYARAGNGPVLIEAKTYRMRGHAEHDDAAYIPKEELVEWRKRDPIDRYLRFLRENGHLTDQEEQSIRKRVESEIDEAERAALESPWPDPSIATQGVFEDDSIVAFHRWWERD